MLMLRIDVHGPLQQEFATVQALWNSNAETRRVDSFLLSWVKYEKQLRRLFCFLVYQHPRIETTHIDSVISILAENRKLNPLTFTKGIRELGVKPVEMLVGERHGELVLELKRIKRLRNKLMHGQITGQKVQSRQLERDVKHIVDWIALLAAGAEAEFGYDGLGRNTFKKAKGAVRQAVAEYPFAAATEFRAWLRRLSDD
jgi:hypothetical protein